MDFRPPKPGDTVIYRCTYCNKQFSHKIPEPTFFLRKKKVMCPECKHIAFPDNRIHY